MKIVEAPEMEPNSESPKLDERPEERIRSVEGGRTMFTNLEAQNEQADKNLALVRGLIDGNPPWDPVMLKKKNLEDKTNLNMREMEGIIANWVTTYHDLIAAVPRFVDVTCYASNITPDLKHQYEVIIAEEMTKTLNAWIDFPIEIMLQQVEMAATGMGPVHFPHPTSFHFVSCSRAAVHIEAGTKLSGSNMDYLLIKDTIPVKDLWLRVRSEDYSRESEAQGWIQNAIKQVLIRAEKGGFSGDVAEAYAEGPWTALQEQVRNNDLGWAVDKEDVPVAHLYVREYDDSITHYIFDTSNIASDWLYKKRNAYQEWDQCMQPFVFEIMSRKMRGAKGLGHKSYAHVQVNNRLMCHIIDSAFAHSTLIFQGGSGNDAARAKAFTWGPRTILPAGMNFKQSLMGTAMDGPMSVMNMVSQRLGKNNRVDTMQQQTRGQASRLAADINDERENQADVERSKILLYYRQMDRMMAEIFRRMSLKTRKPGDRSEAASDEFQARCQMRGVPIELLHEPGYVEVTAARAIGFGSARNRKRNFADLNTLKPEFDEAGRRALNRDIVVDLVGMSNADRYYPPVNRDNIPSTEHTLIALENAHLKKGEGIPVGNDQLHVIHCQGHAQDIAPVMQQHQAGSQQIDPRMLLPYIDAFLPHFGAHVQNLAGDPARQAQAQEYGQFLQRVNKWRAQVNQQASMIAQRQQQEQAAQQADMQRRMEQASQNKVAEAQVKAQQDAQAKTIIGLARVEADKEVGMARANAEKETEIIDGR